MNAIRIVTHLESDTVHLPELRPLVGKRVEIIVLEEPSSPATTEQDWEDFFALHGPDLVDSETYRQYREFDRQQNQPPQL